MFREPLRTSRATDRAEDLPSRRASESTPQSRTSTSIFQGILLAVLPRDTHLEQLRRLARQFPVLALVGPRQVGKTTLARQLFATHRGRKTYLDLERPADLALLEDLSTAEDHLAGFVVIDEVQRRPELFPSIRALVDRPRRPPRFLVLGSASPQLLRQSSESLAGRIATYRLPGLSLGEVGAGNLSRLWVRGGFPRAYLGSPARSLVWREQFVQTFLERDLPGLGIIVPPTTLRRFWSMLAHVHGQVLNLSELGRSMSVSDQTVRHYVDLLAQTFMLRVLAPWYENISKRQVKAPKIYFRDSGLLHAMLGVEDSRQLASHPVRGASWEGFGIDQIIATLGVRDEDCYFWGSHSGAELDLLVMHRGKRIGFELKHTAAPKLTPSMKSAIEDLKLDRLYAVHSGDRSFSLGPRVEAVALSRLERLKL